MKKWFQSLREKLRGMPRLRKTVIGVVGGTVILIGVALVVLPGPAIIVIPLGVAILATEFAWARSVLKRGRLIVRKARDRMETAGAPRG
jgi:tellurite resistance protein TerC